MSATNETTEEHIRQALICLKYLESEQGILINGNFTAIAKKYHIKVKELREAYKQAK